MYAQLGDIVFEFLKGFTSYEDERETTYAQHQLIESKPRLAGTGEALQEISITIKFHAAFCNPEVEYDALDEHRINRDILPLVLGSGFYENDFVITKLKKIPIQTDNDGNYIDLNVEVSLLEFYDPNKIITRQQRAQLTAFAVDVERPLPAPAPKVDRTLSAQLYKYQQAIRNDVFRVTQKINKIESQMNEFLGAPNAIINQGQQFANVANKAYAEIGPLSARITNNLTLATNLLSGHSNLLAINPGITATLAGGSSASAALTSALNPFTTLPGTISNATQGQFCIDIFNNAKTASTNLSTSNDSIFSAFSLFAIFIALRKKRL